MQKLSTALNYHTVVKLSLLLLLVKVPWTAQGKLFVLLISINIDQAPAVANKKWRLHGKGDEGKEMGLCLTGCCVTRAIRAGGTL